MNSLLMLVFRWDNDKAIYDIRKVTGLLRIFFNNKYFTYSPLKISHGKSNKILILSKDPLHLQRVLKKDACHTIIVSQTLWCLFGRRRKYLSRYICPLANRKLED